MLVELRVQDLGVIEDATLLLGPGLIALTGETGAGKTLVVEALELLLGGRADIALVRSGADRAVVEGRFCVSSGAPHEVRDLVLARELPSEGRSRASIDGRMATAGALAEIGASLVDLHGQHAHQSLLHQRSQREALDSFAGVQQIELLEIEHRLHELDRRLEELGGDTRTLARELDLLEFQVRELDGAGLGNPEEESVLEDEEAVLGAAEALRHAATRARRLLAGTEAGPGGGDPPGAVDLVGDAAAALAGRPPLLELAERLAGVSAELADVAGELRRRAEHYEDDPVRLEEVQQRQRLLAELRRKYGETLPEVIAYRESARARLDDLRAGESRRAELEAARGGLMTELAAAEERVGDLRRRGAPILAELVAAHLGTLALPRARLEIVVPQSGRGDAVEWRFGANPGEPAMPLSKVASGGELARAMLATRLVLSEAPPTLVFDEVDAGVGGEAALAVGRALHELALRHQVLVVTHLAQVAAFADSQIRVTKEDRDGRTVALVHPVSGEERLVELSRMLSGQPGSAAARRHAQELLEVARG